jgi:ATP-dependent DNA ligase
MAKREFLQLAHPYKVSKHAIAGWVMSEKLDGMRCFWDGGITNGIPAKDIPWANTAKDVKTRMSTGLWSRYGKPIHAPQGWLTSLPNFPLDGELWSGRGNFQLTRSVTSKHIPIEAEWANVSFMVFDSPTLYDVFHDGIIDNTQYKKKFFSIPEYLHRLGADLSHHSESSFAGVLSYLQDHLVVNDVVKLHEQLQLSYSQVEVDAEISNKLQEVLSAGGEGLILRDPDYCWIPERTHSMVKVKPTLDAEATVVGYVTGRETDKGSKLLGLMGALVCEFQGKRFELSGFTDTERVLQMNCLESAYDTQLSKEQQAYVWAMNHPGQEVPKEIDSRHFPRGSQVTFKYRELSDAGIPKEARYWRKA